MITSNVQINTMSRQKAAEMISVIIAYLNGETIIKRLSDVPDGGWWKCNPYPEWNWHRFTYKVQENEKPMDAPYAGVPAAFGGVR